MASAFQWTLSSTCRRHAPCSPQARVHAGPTSHTHLPLTHADSADAFICVFDQHAFNFVGYPFSPFALHHIGAAKERRDDEARRLTLCVCRCVPTLRALFSFASSTAEQPRGRRAARTGRASGKRQRTIKRSRKARAQRQGRILTVSASPSLRFRPARCASSERTK